MAVIRKAVIAYWIARQWFGLSRWAKRRADWWIGKSVAWAKGEGGDEIE